MVVHEEDRCVLGTTESDVMSGDVHIHINDSVVGNLDVNEIVEKAQSAAEPAKEIAPIEFTRSMFIEGQINQQMKPMLNEKFDGMARKNVIRGRDRDTAIKGWQRLEASFQITDEALRHETGIETLRNRINEIADKLSGLIWKLEPPDPPEHQAWGSDKQPNFYQPVTVRFLIDEEHNHFAGVHVKRHLREDNLVVTITAWYDVELV